VLVLGTTFGPGEAQREGRREHHALGGTLPPPQGTTPTIRLVSAWDSANSSTPTYNQPPSHPTPDRTRQHRVHRPRPGLSTGAKANTGANEARIQRAGPSVNWACARPCSPRPESGHACIKIVRARASVTRVNSDTPGDPNRNKKSAIFLGEASPNMPAQAVLALSVMARTALTA
jgi:hypothetical protein